jgi:hypothetical protein
MTIHSTRGDQELDVRRERGGGVLGNTRVSWRGGMSVASNTILEGWYLYHSNYGHPAPMSE